MMTITSHSHIDTPAAVSPHPLGSHARPGVSDRNHTEVISVSPTMCGNTGENRLPGNIKAIGFDAHAAVRMHDFPVSGCFWAYGQKTKTRHFQRLKVAT